MASVRTTIEVTGDVDKFHRAAKRMRDPSAFMRDVGNLGVNSSKTRLAASTAAHEGRSTHALQGSITMFSFTRDEAVIGSNLPYAAQRNYGGPIFPRTAKALAIPLHDSTSAFGLSPRDVDPDRRLLDFVPARGGASGNVFGLLVDTEGNFGTPGEAIFALATHVDQEGAHFLGWDAEDVQTIQQDIWPRYIAEP